MSQDFEGLRFVLTLYPGYISIPVNYPLIFKFEDRNVCLSILEHRDAVIVTDLTNTLVKNELGTYSLRKPVDPLSDNSFQATYTIGDAGTERVFIYDYNLRTEKFITSRFYSLISIVYEIRDPENITVEEEKFSKRLLGEFVYSYKFFIKDARVRLPEDVIYDQFVEKVDVIRYSPEDKSMPVEKRLIVPRSFNIGIKGLRAFEPRESVPHTTDEQMMAYKAVKQYFEAGTLIRDEFRYLLKAFEEIDLHKNYKYALLESFIVAETVISIVLRGLKLQRGISKTVQDKFRLEVGIGYQLNIELPSLLNPLSEKEREVLTKVNQIRKLRNNVIHEGVSVGVDDAINAVNTVTSLIMIFKDRGLI